MPVYVDIYERILTVFIRFSNTLFKILLYYIVPLIFAIGSSSKTLVLKTQIYFKAFDMCIEVICHI